MIYVKLINRTSKNLEGVWDGKHEVITPGEHHYPEIMATKYRDQNPIMGTENPYTLDKQYLIGIVEHGDDCSPIEQSTSLELGMWNRPVPATIVRGNGLYSPSIDGAKPLGPASTFDKP